MKRFIPLLGAGLAVLGGCGESSDQRTATTSSVTGALSVATFPSKPTAVDVIDEASATSHIAVDEQGRFQVSLAKGHTYRFAVAMPSGSEPLVFPRASKRLDTTVHIATAAATISLGAIRHFSAAPADGFAVQSASGTSSAQTQNATSGDGNVGECVDGSVKGTGAPCVDDGATASCDNGSGQDGQNDNGADGETNDTATDADPTKPMAVPEHNAPDDVAGCNEGGDGETNDD